MDIVNIFTALLVASGLIWLADSIFFKPKRQLGATARTAEPLVVQYARSFFPVLLVVLSIRAFVIEPFRIPSASMMPGLIDGDFIFVDKFSYGLRLPVLNSKIAATGEPRRGDVVVFRLPSDPSTHFIKRLIGLPGDHVRVRANQVFINGVPAAQVADGRYSGSEFNGSPLSLESIQGRSHVLMFAANRMATDFEADVPAGHYFFMGDNRNDSEDSRFAPVGFVPAENLDGRAVRIWMNWRIPGWPQWQRVGMKIS